MEFNSPLSFCCVAACAFTAPQAVAQSAQVKVTVTNLGTTARHELVAVDAELIRQRLNVSDTAQLVVLGTFGQQIDYQLTYDGQLLIDAAVLPISKAEYRITTGTPRQAQRYAEGAVYPQRLDDLAWENDHCAYRLYGPALQRKGERSYGIDVWTKSCPQPVIAQRYRRHLDGNRQADSLRKAGQKETAGKVRTETSFHIDHGNGMDGYGVGPTLGCGAPALVIDGQMQMPWCYERCTILDNGPLRFTAELTYPTTASGITEHRRIQLDKGSRFCRMTVWYDGLKQPVALVAGVVLHGGEPVLAKDYVLYADPTEKPRQYQSQIFVATLFPEGVDNTCTMENATPHSDHRSENAEGYTHAVGKVDNYNGQPFTYYFGAAWSLYDVQSMAHWQLCAEDFLTALKQPLELRITN